MSSDAGPSSTFSLNPALKARDPQGGASSGVYTTSNVSHAGCDARLAILAHELRSPLQVLRVAVEQAELAAQTGRDEPSNRTARLQTIVARQRRALARLQRSIDLVLEVCRLDSGRAELECEPFDMSELVREQLGLHADAFAAAGCSCSYDGPPRLVGTWDRVRVELALGNLLANAIRYAAGAPIDVSLQADPRWARISVRDHGPGIALAEQERIFQPFVRGGGSSASQGSGLGLWLVKSVALAHGGDVALVSSPSRGATFTLMLPRSGCG